MNLFTKLKAFFKKAEPSPALRPPSPQEEAHFSFSNDPGTVYKTQEEMIPEMRPVMDKIHASQPLLFTEIATYFKYFENGYDLKSPYFKLKPEFCHNSLFQIESIKTFVNPDGSVKAFHLILKEEVTGYRVVIEAPTSFITEFAIQIPPPVLSVSAQPA